MASFDPKRTACIDISGSTKIWRGNIPINSEGNFAYAEMAETLGLTQDTPLIDVSLIDNVERSERSQWLVELDAYSVDVSAQFPSGQNIPPQFNQPEWNPAQLLGSQGNVSGNTFPGHLVWWQIEGGDTPDVLGPDVRSYNFIGLITYLGTLRKIQDAVLYIHCMNGTDRTGAVVAGYAMRWMGMSLVESMDLANSVTSAGTMNSDYKKLVERYWKWLSVS